MKLNETSEIENDDREPGRYLVKACPSSEWEILKWDDGWLLEFDGFDKDCGVYDIYLAFGPLP